MATADALKTRITAEEFGRMPLEGPAELVRGEIVELPMPDQVHGVVCGNVYFAITTWARSTGHGVATINDSHIVTEREPDTARGPDVCYFPRERLRDGKLPRGVCEAVPGICVEVRSPSDRWAKIRGKVDEYLKRGVDEVWVVDVTQRVVHVFHQDEAPVEYGSDDELKSERVLPSFSCRVEELFVEA
jgi:Uma2 family endonuclease